MKKQSTFSLSEKAKEKLKILAKNEGRSKSNMIEALIDREYELIKDHDL